mmetsp:Transcript_10834/g.18422  ORF Transcript_10834/g.18422 Transcript_10834/m.18422 type:complete len:443 (+) Transcript_10834:265-1593(+)
MYGTPSHAPNDVACGVGRGGRRAHLASLASRVPAARQAVVTKAQAAVARSAQRGPVKPLQRRLYEIVLVRGPPVLLTYRCANRRIALQIELLRVGAHKLLQLRKLHEALKHKPRDDQHVAGHRGHHRCRVHGAPLAKQRELAKILRWVELGQLQHMLLRFVAALCAVRRRLVLTPALLAEHLHVRVGNFDRAKNTALSLHQDVHAVRRLALPDDDLVRGIASVRKTLGKVIELALWQVLEDIDGADDVQTSAEPALVEARQTRRICLPLQLDQPRRHRRRDGRGTLRLLVRERQLTEGVAIFEDAEIGRDIAVRLVAHGRVRGAGEDHVEGRAVEPLHGHLLVSWDLPEREVAADLEVLRHAELREEADVGRCMLNILQVLRRAQLRSLAERLKHLLPRAGSVNVLILRREELLGRCPADHSVPWVQQDVPLHHFPLLYWQR